MTEALPSFRDRLAANVESAREHVKRWDWWLYALVSGTVTVWVACWFYSSLHQQTLYAKLWAEPQRFDSVAQHGLNGDWSAPLDDVFIHFDFARSIARGHPFEWIAGNGYSSGGTSLTYPFALALGYIVGFRGLKLMAWAGVVACVSVLALLLAARRAFTELPGVAAYLTPFALLSTGVLCWTLFSGMEVALFLGVWGACFVMWDDTLRAATCEASVRSGLLLGAGNLALVATRPEAAPTVAIFSLSAGWVVHKNLKNPKTTLRVIGSAALPGALLVLGQALVNRWLTGDFTAAGALAKLELHHPYLTLNEVWDKWLFHVKYQILRVTQYHLGDHAIYGWIVWLFAAAALVFQKTRRYALLLWASAAAWVLTVALNGQVRWQNERYTMPALAWLLLAATLGVVALLDCDYEKAAKRLKLTSSRGLRASLGLMVVGLSLTFVVHQRPRFIDQVWFFGRASRNILDQHVAAGLLLRKAVKPQPKRILLSDAGAIPYAADLPALDLIGLGGYRHMPFARAGRLGAPADLELIERLPKRARPDMMALYPSWWQVLPLWFGKRIEEVPVRGNVICGGQSKVLYRSNWSPFDGSGKPFGLPSTERVVDTVDVADIISEHDHDFELGRRGVGHVTMKMLPHPQKRSRDLWDAGRLLAPGVEPRFHLTGIDPKRLLRLSFRVAPAQSARFRVDVDEKPVGEVELSPGDSWQEEGIEVPAARLKTDIAIRIAPVGSGFALYHVWASQAP